MGIRRRVGVGILVSAAAIQCSGPSELERKGGDATARSRAAVERERLRDESGTVGATSRSREGRLPAGITKAPERPGHYLMRRPSSATWFTPTGFAWTLLAGGSKPVAHNAAPTRGWGLAADFVGARGQPPSPERPDGARVHARSRGHATPPGGLPSYSRLVWEDLYPGIDLIAEPGPAGASYRFLVLPGARLENVRMRWQGASALHLADRGRGLDVETEFGALRIRGLHAFELTADGQRELAARHQLSSSDEVGLSVDGWSGSAPLVIDPTISWSSFLGGTSNDDASDIVMGPNNTYYVVGRTPSPDFPTTGGFDTTLGLADAFVAKLSPAGGLIWSSYLGGSSDEWGSAVAVDTNGDVFVTGYTMSSDFPATGGFDTSLSGMVDAFVTKVSSAGALLWSSYLGGAGRTTGNGIAVDGSGNALVSGITEAPDFPTTGGFDTTFGGGPQYQAFDYFLTKVSGSGALVWSSYLGGSDLELQSGGAVAVDPTGNAYVAGGTWSSDFPTTGGFDTTFAGPSGTADATLTKVSSAGALLWSTYLGGSGADVALTVATDPGGNAYVAGLADSSDFPVPGGFDTTFGWGNGDGFVAKVSPSATLLWSSFLGGTGYEAVSAATIDKNGDLAVTGSTSSTDFPTSGGFDATLGGASDAFVARIGSAGTLLWSSYLGGSNSDYGSGIGASAVDDDLIIVGSTNSSDFPLINGFDSTAVDTEGFLVRLHAQGALGAPCTLGSQCLSGLFCVDSVCCAQASCPGGLCGACSAAKKGSGTDGTCGFVKDGADPNSACAPASCTAGVKTNAQVCNGSGACRSNGTVSCAPFLCSGATCATGCYVDTDCAAGAYCNYFGKCEPKHSDGWPCDYDKECSGGKCSANQCCTPSAGTCSSPDAGSDAATGGTGGSTATGGTGGSTATGGTGGSTGGSTATGGTGGSTATGGTGGSTATGGTGNTSAGGSAGAASGGTGNASAGGSAGTATGGTGNASAGGSAGTATGGSTATGGASTTGGAAGSPTAGAAGSSSASSDDGGCGCRAAGSQPERGAWLALLAGLLLASGRRNTRCSHRIRVGEQNRTERRSCS